MKKNIFKKIVASLATVAMAAGLFTVMPAEEAKAASAWDDGTVYIIGNESVFASWNNATAPAMTYAGGVYTYSFDAVSGKVYEFKFLPDLGSWDGAWGASSGNFAYLALNNGTATITFDPTKSGDEAVSVTGLVSPNPEEEFYVVGDMNGWDTVNSDKMTEDDGLFTYTYEDLVAGNYGFKVCQDAPTYAYYKSYPGDNKTFELTAKSDVKITFDSDSKEITVVATPVQEESSNTSTENTNNSTEANQTTTGSQETTAAADKTTTKAPETTKKEEAKKGITVEVALSADAKWDKVFIYAFPEGEGLKAWPGVEMTAKDGKWYATLDTTATKLSYVISNGNGEQTVDVKDVEGQNIKITLGAKNAEGKFEASAKAVAAGGTGSAKPGDAAPMVMMFAVAAVAAGMVVASKKKTICE